MRKHRFESAEVLIVNGQRRDGQQPALLANLPGILRGEGVFESFLVYDRQTPPFLDRHDARLRHSARLMKMDLHGQGLATDFPQVAPHLGLGPWRVRYTVLRGLGHGLVRMWTAGPAEPPPAEVDLIISAVRHDPLHPLAGAKTTSRAAYQIAHAEAVEVGAFDAILPTIDGDLAECTSSNLLLWKGNALRTAGLDRGILGGVTRQILLEECGKAGFAVCEQKIGKKDLTEAQEVLVTNAVIGVIPVCRIQGTDRIFPGAHGPMAARIRAIYSAATGHPSRGPAAAPTKEA